MRPRVIVISGVLMATLSWGDTSGAYNCIERPFMNRVDESENIFVARITGGELRPSGRHDIETVFAAFDVVENFKGSVAFDRLVTSADAMSGGVHFVVGAEYLVFTDHTGRVGQCENHGALSPEEIRQTDQPLRERDALRVGKREKFVNFVAPWQFRRADLSDGIFVCSLGQEIRLDGARDLPRWAPVGITVGSLGGGNLGNIEPNHWPSLSLAVNVPGKEDPTNFAASIRIGAKAFSLRGLATGPGLSSTKYSMSGNEVTEFIDELEERPDIRVEIQHPSYGDLSATTHARYIGDALTELRTCIDEQHRTRGE